MTDKLEAAKAIERFLLPLRPLMAAAEDLRRVGSLEDAADAAEARLKAATDDAARLKERMAAQAAAHAAEIDRSQSLLTEADGVLKRRQQEIATADEALKAKVADIEAAARGRAEAILADAQAKADGIVKDAADAVRANDDQIREQRRQIGELAVEIADKAKVLEGIREKMAKALDRVA